jgi:hypothetical protein
VSLGARTLVCACARVALIIQHATHRHIAIYGFSGSTYFWTLSHTGHNFEKKRLLKKKMYFDFLYDFLLEHFSF